MSEQQDEVYKKALKHSIELYTVDNSEITHLPAKVYVFNGFFVITEGTYQEYMNVLQKMQQDNDDFVYSYGSENELFENITFNKRVK
jgi:hypothetical protein